MEKFENLNELIIALLLWITSNTDYINPKQLPEVKFLEQNKLSQLACQNDCEILAYTPVEPKYTVYLSKKLKPLTDVCHRGILLHEIIHVLQDDQSFFADYDDRTKKHLRGLILLYATGRTSEVKFVIIITENQRLLILLLIYLYLDLVKQKRVFTLWLVHSLQTKGLI